MKKDNLYKYYTELPQWAKGVVIVGGVGIVGLLGFRIYRKLFPSESERSAQQLVNSIVSDIQRWRREGLTQSYPDLEYQTLANAAYEGMRYCVGDSYSDVETIMKKMQNNLDVAMLVDAFRTRQNYCFGIPTGTPLDLLSFVRKELGNDWGGITDYRVKNINDNWQRKGITYKL
jgi:hypothetical protein